MYIQVVGPMDNSFGVSSRQALLILSDYVNKSQRMLTSVLFVLLLCRQTVLGASSSSSFGISAPVPLASEALSLLGDATWIRTSGRNVSERSPTDSFSSTPVKQSPPSSELCDKLHLTPRQKQMCVQGGDGLPEALLEAIRMSVFTCQQQFKYERWNCTLDTYSRIPALKKAYKESAALYAFSAAGVAHAVARACAAGRLRKCHCAEADNEVETRQTWRWGGCGDNLAYGRAFAFKFLDASPSSKRPNNVKIETRLDTRNADQKSNKKKKKPKSGIQAEMEVVSRALRRGRRQMNSAHINRRKTSVESGGAGNLVNNGPQPINKDKVIGKKIKNENQRQRINRHNNAVGIKVVEQLVNRTCKCHGVSGSCSVKTCWHQLAQFANTAAVIKVKYDNAVLVNAEIQENSSHLRTMTSSTSKNQENNRILPQSRSKKATDKLVDIESIRSGRNSMKNDPVDTTELIYQQRSPEFCAANPLGPGTVDRQCLRGENCEILCCGRGYNVHSTKENVSCKCKLILCCHVECENCWVDKTIHTCK